MQNTLPLRRLACVLALFVGGFPLTQSSLAETEPVRVTLVPGWEREDGLFVAGIQFSLAPGWKTYWREPGPSGIPPQFDWSGSANVAQVGYFWPAPEVFETFGMQTIGYQGDVILPVLIRPEDPGRPVKAEVSIDFGVCADICIPATALVGATVSADTGRNEDLLNSWIARRAVPAPEAGLRSAACALSAQNDAFVLNAEIAFTAPVMPLEAVVVETSQSHLWISVPDHEVDGSTVRLEADLRTFRESPLVLDRSALRITLIGDNTAIDIRSCS